MKDADRLYLGLIKALPCACCGANGPSSAHHIRTGQGGAQRAGHSLTIPLCWECHQGTNGVHGDQTYLRIYKTDELKMLNNTIDVVVTALLMRVKG